MAAEVLAQQSLPSGTLVAGRYRIVRELGRGGMGVIYVVEHVNTGAELAMKLMLDGTAMIGDRAARFRREARASARISSEHVVKVTDADVAPELNGAPFLVMELLEGMDLERRLMEHGKIETREVVSILSQVARALDKAHAAGVIHRDLKPENVFLHRREDGNEVVKVLDFGISKIMGRNSDMQVASMTSSTEVMGTPLYMAPEQARAKHGDVGPPTDVWAFALVAVRMLTGGHYWSADSITDLLIQIMSDDRTPPSVRFPELPPELDAWFLRSCASNPKARYQTVGEQLNDLAAILTGDRPLRQGSVRPSNGPPAAFGGTVVMSGSVPRGAGSSPGPNPMSMTPGSGGALPAAAARSSSVSGGMIGTSTSAPLSTSTPPPRSSKTIPLVIAAGAVVAGIIGVGIVLARPPGGGSAAGLKPDPSSPPSVTSAAPLAPTVTASSAAATATATAATTAEATDASVQVAVATVATAAATAPVGTVKVNVPLVPTTKTVKSAAPKSSGPSTTNDPFDTQK